MSASEAPRPAAASDASSVLARAFVVDAVPVLEAVGDGVFVLDGAGHMLHTNRRARDLLWDLWIEPSPPDTPASTHGERWTIVDHEGRVLLPDALPWARALTGRTAIEDAMIGLRSEGSSTGWLSITAVPLVDPDDPIPFAVVCGVRDVTDRQSADDLLALNARLLDAVDQAVIAWDTQGDITFVNTKAETIFGWSRSDVLSKPVTDAINIATDADQWTELLESFRSGTLWSGEILIRRSDGSTVPIWTTNTPVRNETQVVGHIGVSVDLSDRQAAEALDAHRTSHDLLTDLLTRQSLVDLLDADLATASPASLPIHLILVDVGSLDRLHDAVGQFAGDRAVLWTARRLAAALHPDDRFARISDHVFAVSCSHGTGTDGTSGALQHGIDLLDRLSVPFNLSGVDVTLHPHAAVAIRDESCDASELLRRADIALVVSRTEGTMRVYDDSMRGEIDRQAELSELVDRTIASGTVTLGYQPIVRLGDQQIIGAEALLRMVDDAGEPVSPPQVIERAERDGRISELGQVILRTACTDASRWCRIAPDHPLRVSVNVSTLQLDDPEFPSLVADALDASGLDPSALCLEVTETALMSDPERSAARLGPLRASGVRFAADDFGTGYSSLSYLKALPLDVLKIDQTFVAGMPDNLEDVAITQAIMAMSDALGLAVTAEGIETEAQLGALLELGTGFGQGFLWGPAIPTADLEERLLGAGDEPVSGPRLEPAPWRITRPEGAGSSEDRIDSILNILAHEIRTPLTVVTGYASVLETTGDAGQAAAAASIGQAAMRINRILSNMVELSTSDDAADGAALVLVDAQGLVATIADNLRTLYDIRLRPQVGVVAPMVAVDLGQVEQVLTNLVSNAAKFSPPGAGIELKVGGAGGWVDISVADEGPGIEPDDLSLIFRKYGRTDPLGRGTGLGLYVARRIARSHGGDILYRNRAPDPGSIFILRLPRSSDADVPADGGFLA